MATIKSIKRAQAPKFCDLCKADIRIQWRCCDCEKYLCDKCNQIHSNDQSSENHDIISIYSSEACTKGQKDRILCFLHKNMTCDKFCEKCDHPVCLDCTLGFHKDHNSKPIDQHCYEKLQLLNGRILKDLSFCKIETRKIKNAKEVYNSKYEEALHKISQREQELKDELTEYANKLREEIEIKKTNWLTTAEEKMDEIIETEENLKEKLMRLNEEIEPNPVKLILKAVSELQKSLPDFHFKHLPMEIKSLTDTSDKQIAVESYFGELQTEQFQIQKPSINFNMIKNHETDLVFVHRIVTLDDKTAWISSCATTSGTLRKINIEETLDTVKDINFSVYDMALTPSKDILMCVLNGSKVNLLTKRGAVQPFLSIEPLLPTGICVTKQNDVILGVTEKYSHTITEQSSRKIVIFGMNGKEKYSYEFDHNGQRLFTLPCRIVVNVNGDILVIDDMSDFNGRIVALGKEGKVQWTYHGNLQINSGDNLFHPEDLVTTSDGTIIIADCNSNAFHVLSCAGDILFSKSMEDHGIHWPMSLDIDTKGQLWVGCYTDNDKFAAELKIVKMSI